HRPRHPCLPPAADLRRVLPHRAARQLGRAGPGPGTVALPAPLQRPRPPAQRALAQRPRQHLLDPATAPPPAAAAPPAGHPRRRPPPPRRVAAPRMPASLEGMRVLCVGTGGGRLAGMALLLGRWKTGVLRASAVDAALEESAAAPDVLLVDCDLDGRMAGLEA